MTTFLEEVREKFTYDPATGHLTRKVKCGKWRAGARVGSTDGKGHRQVRFQGKLYLEHRLIWLLVHGEWPAAELDHINRVRDDNRLCNLRECSHSQNMKNQGRKNTNSSGHTGVSFYKPHGKYVAYITCDGQRKHLGYFEALEDAIAARAAAERNAFGAFGAEHGVVFSRDEVAA